MMKFILGMVVGAIITGALTYTGGKLNYHGDSQSALDNAKNFVSDITDSVKSK